MLKILIIGSGVQGLAMLHAADKLGVEVVQPHEVCEEEFAAEPIHALVNQAWAVPPPELVRDVCVGDYLSIKDVEQMLPPHVVSKRAGITPTKTSSGHRTERAGVWNHWIFGGFRGASGSLCL